MITKICAIEMEGPDALNALWRRGYAPPQQMEFLLSHFSETCVTSAEER